ncbi:class I SAM-dependent methyltransferase [Raoultibacter timonensis]|uniref:class I SAM-dependent methyltransferase n=1 Tax=Raoultibacter timonensis TaxID=1907662 RepID=UPI0026DCA3F5|nr:class I SAM-dependent methyltransferase [Raoultibacter timonensis]
MENKQPSILDLLIEAHVGLERQGPGSAETTCKALGFLGDLAQISHAADLGCGSGPQTLELARHVPGSIVGLDMFPDFIDVLNENAGKQGLGGRVKGIVGSMDDLPFDGESLDLIWSEGAIDNIGFEEGIAHWRGFLKKGGYLAVTCPSWLTAEHPEVIERFWSDAGSGLDSVEHNVAALQACGYRFVASFALPEYCWTDEYFAPREAALQGLLKKYPDSETVEAFVAENRHEVKLYSEYKRHYGYVFYIGQKR